MILSSYVLKAIGGKEWYENFENTNFNYHLDTTPEPVGVGTAYVSGLQPG